MSESTKNILRVFFATCVLILVIDVFVPRTHIHYEWENWKGFYGAYGFFSCVILVYIAKYGLRPLVMRDEEPDE